MDKILTFIQKLVSADKALLVGVITQSAIGLAGSFGLHMSAAAVGIVEAVASAVIAYFVGIHYADKLAAAKAEAKKS